MDNLDRIIKKVREYGKTRPDTTYPRAPGVESCQYGSGECNDGSIGCIMGQVLIDLGLDPWITEDIGIGGILEEYGFRGSRVEWCIDVQCNQDDGMTWDEAIRQADN